MKASRIYESICIIIMIIIFFQLAISNPKKENDPTTKENVTIQNDNYNHVRNW